MAVDAEETHSRHRAKTTHMHNTCKKQHTKQICSRYREDAQQMQQKQHLHSCHAAGVPSTPSTRKQGCSRSAARGQTHSTCAADTLQAYLSKVEEVEHFPMEKGTG